MGLFEYDCECGEHYEELQDRAFKSIRCSCGKRANRVYSTFRTIVDFRDGWDVGLGEFVDTKRERDSLLRKKNLRKAGTIDNKARWV